MTEDFIINALALDGKGAGTRLSGDTIAEKVKAKGLAWVHLDANRPEAREWLKTHIDYLDDVIVDALLAPDTRPRVSEYGNGAMVILRGINLNEDAEPEDMISIRFWIDPDRIISTRFRKLKSVQDIRERLEAGTGPKTSADFFVDLATRMFERMEPIMSEMDEQIDAVEEQLLEGASPELRQEIIEIRRRAIILRRYIAPQKEVMSFMRESDFKWINDTHRRLLNENYDRIMRYLDVLDSIRERSQIVKEELASMMADRMNRNMYILSIVASIFLPLGFLTGLLGINVGGMPGADNPDAFWLVAGLCLFFILLVAGLFKLLKWV